MKLMHLSDLHIGRRFAGVSLIDDQRHILTQVISAAEREKPDAVLLAGDIYDKPAPSADAVSLFDEFLTELSACCSHVFVISGNHDSAERIAFGGRLMGKSGVYVSPVYGGSLRREILRDEYGPVEIWMLPFIKPAHVRQFDETVDPDDITGAVRQALKMAGMDGAPDGAEEWSEAAEPGEEVTSAELREAAPAGVVRRVLIAHQYVTGAQRSESEETPIGGLDGVDSAVLEGFDYVALGHLHRRQRAGGEHIRYSGSPIAYSFSEAGDPKCLLMVHLDGRGKTAVREEPLLPLHDIRILSGSFDELMGAAHGETGRERQAYIRAELTDEEYIPDGIQRLRTVYPNILELAYPRITSAAGEGAAEEIAAFHTPIEYVEEFFRTMRGREMSRIQRELALEVIREIWEEES